MARIIEVSTAVFAAIWAARREGEESEDQILSRLLGATATTGDASQPKAKGERRVRWIDDVATAMKQLGGRAHYAELYDEVRQIRMAAGRSLPASANSIIRREIEYHAGESEAFLGGSDLFYAPDGIGAGVWALRTKGKKES